MIDLQNKTQYIADILKVLGQKDRLDILCFLSDGPKNVSAIQKYLSISQSQTSQFLQKMKFQWLLESEKFGKEIHYSIADKDTLALMQSIKYIYCREE